MSNDNEDSRWMDESDPDPELQAGLTCHVELTIEGGTTFRDLLEKAAWALRTAAVQVEGGQLKDGFHPITTLKGEKLGEIYLDHYGIM